MDRIHTDDLIEVSGGYSLLRASMGWDARTEEYKWNPYPSLLTVHGVFELQQCRIEKGGVERIEKGRMLTAIEDYFWTLVLHVLHADVFSWQGSVSELTCWEPSRGLNSDVCCAHGSQAPTVLSLGQQCKLREAEDSTLNGSKTTSELSPYWILPPIMFQICSEAKRIF